MIRSIPGGNNTSYFGTQKGINRYTYGFMMKVTVCMELLLKATQYSAVEIISL